MVRYKLFKGLHFTMGVDLLLLGQKETSKPGFSDRPNYSTWRLSGKINFAPSTAFYAAPTFVSATQSGGTGRERRSFESVTSAGGQTPLFNRQELFRWGIEERGLDVQSVDLDLEKIRPRPDESRRRTQSAQSQTRRETEKRSRKIKRILWFYYRICMYLYRESGSSTESVSQGGSSRFPKQCITASLQVSVVLKP